MFLIPASAMRGTNPRGYHRENFTVGNGPSCASNASASFGAAGTRRLVLCGATAGDSGRSPSSMYLGDGFTSGFHLTDDGLETLAMGSKEQYSLTTGTASYCCNAGTGQSMYTLYALYDLVDMTAPHDTQLATSGTLNINVPENGIIVFCGYGAPTSASAGLEITHTHSGFYYSGFGSGLALEAAKTITITGSSMNLLFATSWG